jgi:hypothetical protein
VVWWQAPRDPRFVCDRQQAQRGGGQFSFISRQDPKTQRYPCSALGSLGLGVRPFRGVPRTTNHARNCQPLSWSAGASEARHRFVCGRQRAQRGGGRRGKSGGAALRLSPCGKAVSRFACPRPVIRPGRDTPGAHPPCHTAPQSRPEGPQHHSPGQGRRPATAALGRHTVRRPGSGGTPAAGWTNGKRRHGPPAFVRECGFQIAGRWRMTCPTAYDGARPVNKEPIPYNPFSPPKNASKTLKRAFRRRKSLQPYKNLWSDPGEHPPENINHCGSWKP